MHSPMRSHARSVSLSVGVVTDSQASTGRQWPERGGLSNASIASYRGITCWTPLFSDNNVVQRTVEHSKD